MRFEPALFAWVAPSEHTPLDRCFLLESPAEPDLRRPAAWTAHLYVRGSPAGAPWIGNGPSPEEAILAVQQRYARHVENLVPGPSGPAKAKVALSLEDLGL